LLSRKKLLLGLLFLLLFGLSLYLPNLGVKEFQGEEGRRVVYALSMLETKNFLIPTLFGEPYFTKPPVFNWVLAGAFAITRDYSEWTARMVSSLSIILTSLFLLFLWKDVVKPSSLFTLLLPSLIYLTTPEVIDKALRAEIDAFYSLLVGLYVYLWFYLYEIKNRKSLSYFLAGIIAGFAVLTKTFHALLFFYLALVPYLYTERSLRDLFKLNRHFLFLFGVSLVFCSWIFALHLKGIDIRQIVDSWIGEYKSAASAKEMTPSQHFTSYTFGALFSLSPWLFFLSFYLKHLPKDNPLHYKLFKYSAFLFILSYFFHFLFPGARFRYIMPSLSGFAILCAIPMLYLDRVFSFSLKKLFTALIVLVFIGKQAYTFFYYPYHAKNLNYFRRSALEVAELLQGKRTLYLCKALPHHLVYYLKYRYRVVDDFIYLREIEDCRSIPAGAFVLIEKRSLEGMEIPRNWVTMPLKVRTKDYFLIKVQ
jgi:4-amino-4-deoxy-L-arabinose transferase-like glycosyltransferase